MGQPLLIAQLDPAEVQHRVLHRASDSLTAPASLALEERRQNSRHQVDAGTGIADLGAGHQGTRSISPVVDAAPPVHCATFS